MLGAGWKWRLSVVVIVAGIGTAAQGGGAKGSTAKARGEKKVERWAESQQNAIQVHPSEVTFEVPEAWRSGKTFFRLTRNELQKKVGRDWIGTQIADGVLKLEDCAAQITPDKLNWLRVYVVDATEEQVLKRIQEKGWKAAGTIPNYIRGYSSGFQTVPAKESPWTHADIPYELDFGDYNGGGYVSFYLRPAGGKQLVMVFGHFAAGALTPPDERENILKSVVVPASGI
jgi:hypothetical protein